MSPENPRHIIIQNTPDILDPNQQRGCEGKVARLILHLLARSLHMAGEGDLVVVGKVPGDFRDYVRRIAGQNPRLVEVPLTPPLYTQHLLNPLKNESLLPGRYSLNPYIQSETVAKWSKETGIPMAHTPPEIILRGVVRRAN
ncbi:MAG: hypothetical protein ACPLXP_03100, partial [Microgenomates group bacterium]